MKSIGARLALWYAGAATLTLLCLFVAGYYLLEGQLIRGLDLLNEAQFAQISAHLGEDFASLNAEVIDARIRETSNFSAVLFFITIDDRKAPVRPVFYSTNLRGLPIPDVPGRRTYDTQLAGIGELRPVRLIRETATHISSDNLSERIPVADIRDEISELAQLLNQMFDRLESAFDQIRRFTAEATHELKTPLSRIRLQAEKLLMHGKLDPANEESVHDQLKEIARLSQIIEELLFLSRAEARDIDLAMINSDPEALLTAFNQDACVLSEHRGLQFVHSHSGLGRVLVEPRWLRRVLLNLVANALNASPAGGTVTLSSVLRDGVWRVSLDDQGPGVPPDLRELIFERFFRSAAATGDDGGSGLGLAICRSIVSLHGGHIWVEPVPVGPGLRVVFTIPGADALASAT